LSSKLPAAYCTCSTGPDEDELEVLAFEKGSLTKRRFEAPFAMRPLERPQLDVMKDCVPELSSVALGKGSVVLVDSENCDATDAAGVAAWDNARAAKRAGRKKASRLTMLV